MTDEPTSRLSKPRPPVPGKAASRRFCLIPIALGLLLALGFLLGPTPEAQAKEWDSVANNVVLSIGDEPLPWKWLSFNAAWGKAHIVKGASRVLSKLKSGEPTDGQGALMHLAILDAEEDMKLDNLAESKVVKSFFFTRFKGTEEDVESETFDIESGSNKDGHPALVLRAKGEASNLKAKKAPCTGILVLTISRGKLYMLRLYAFPTEYDDESLVGDIDYMETNCLRLIDTTEKKSATPGAKPPADGGGEPKEGEGPPVEEKREDVVLENRAQKWRITIDKKLNKIEITDDEKKDFLELKYWDSDTHGGYVFYVYALPNTQYIDGVLAPQPDLFKWMSTTWWNSFTTNHPKGDIYTFKFPRKPEGKNPTFLTLPDFSNEKARVAVVTGKKKRPVEVSKGDMVKKLKAIEKPKKNKIGKRGKGGEALRGILQGKRPRTAGLETVIRYAFRTPTHSYRVFVTFNGEGHKKWGPALRKTLESWEFGLKFK